MSVLAKSKPHCMYNYLQTNKMPTEIKNHSSKASTPWKFGGNPHSDFDIVLLVSSTQARVASMFHPICIFLPELGQRAYSYIYIYIYISTIYIFLTGVIALMNLDANCAFRATDFRRWGSARRTGNKISDIQ